MTDHGRSAGRVPASGLGGIAIVTLVHYMVVAWDVDGPEGTERRDGARAAHTESIGALWEAGHVVLGAGILDDDGQVRGSLVVVDYPDRDDVDRYLEREPFVTESVWDRIEVHPLFVPGFYLQGLASP